MGEVLDTLEGLDAEERARRAEERAVEARAERAREHSARAAQAEDRAADEARSAVVLAPVDGTADEAGRRLDEAGRRLLGGRSVEETLDTVSSWVSSAKLGGIFGFFCPPPETKSHHRFWTTMTSAFAIQNETKNVEMCVTSCVICVLLFAFR